MSAKSRRRLPLDQDIIDDEAGILDSIEAEILDERPRLCAWCGHPRFAHDYETSRCAYRGQPDEVGDEDACPCPEFEEARRSA